MHSIGQITIERNLVPKYSCISQIAILVLGFILFCLTLYTAAVNSNAAGGDAQRDVRPAIVYSNRYRDSSGALLSSDWRGK